VEKAGIIVTATALVVGPSGAALAQQSSTANTATNASRSGGPGTHVGAERTGSASNTEKVIGNHNGYSGQ
jgi:hypothetical protein